MIIYLKIAFLVVVISYLIPAQNEILRYEQNDSGNRIKYTLENITTSDGLHNNYTRDILQDYTGFLWIASETGLQRYDGYTFKLYSPDSSALTSQRPIGLYEDKHKNLWIRMEKGLLRYRRDTDDFVKYYFVKESKDTVRYNVSALAESQEGTLWLWIQNQGLYRIDTSHNSFVPHTVINKWYQEVNHPKILKEGKRKGFFETWVTFPAGEFGTKLQYKFTIKRKNGTLQWEPNPNPAKADNYSNREIILNGDTVILPIVSFNSEMEYSQEEIKTINESDLKRTFVKFTVNMNGLDSSLLQGEEVQLRGSNPPLLWDSNVSVSAMIFDSENNLWFGVGNLGLFRCNLVTGEIKHFVANPGITGQISSNSINDAILDREGNLWFGTMRGLNRYIRNQNRFENYFINPAETDNIINIINKMKEDGYGNIWTISYSTKGANYFNKRKNKFINFTNGLTAWLSSVTSDRSGIIWLGNWYRGLYKLKPDAANFAVYTINRNGKDLLEGNVIEAVYEDQKGDIWTGGELNGLYRLDRKTGNSITYRADPNISDKLILDYTTCIFQDSKGIFWIGTRGGLYRFDPETGLFDRTELYPGINRGLGRTTCIYENKDGLFWVVTRNGYLVQFNPDTYEAEYFSVYNNSEIDRQMEFVDLVEDPAGFLWIGTANRGLLKFEINKKSFSLIDNLKRANITTLCLDASGILWCATIGQGIIRYDTKKNTKIIIDKRKGLLSNDIMGMEMDNSGNLWLSSNRGLSSYNPNKGTFKNYFKEDGFLTNEFSYRAHFKSKRGEMIFGSLHGLVAFYPDSINTSDYISPIVLTGIRIRNRTVTIGENESLKKQISVADKITLNYDQNDIEISFASLDFSRPERNEYSYILENFEESWRPPGPEHTAYYSNLAPGEYIFKVKGTNGDGVWNEQPAELKIIIHPPFWQTWWSYGIYVLFAIGLLYGMRRYELNRLYLKNQIKLDEIKLKERETADKMKSTFFANISHEFRTPLTLILGPLLKMLESETDKNKKHNLDIMQRNAERLLRLINQLLDFSKLESGKMGLQASKADIVSFVKGILASFHSLAEQHNITYQFTSGRAVIEMFFDQEKAEKIFINLISNAFKFTPDGGTVKVGIELSSSGSVAGDGIRTSGSNGNPGDYVEITVSNTGSGILPEKLEKIFERFYQIDHSTAGTSEGTGIGLALTKELVELHSGEIKVDSEPGLVTTFTILLPSGNKHFRPEEILDITPDISSERNSEMGGTTSYQNSGSNIDFGHKSSLKNRPIILVIEDNADMRDYMHQCLGENYNVRQAEDGETGFQQAIKYMPDLIISDVMMPGMDGFQLCTKIKTDKRTSHIPVILLTAKASGESKITGLETGADDYLTKPFSTRELQIRIKNLVDQRKKLWEKFRKEILINPGEITVTSIDEQLLQRAISAVENNISDPAFDTTALANQVGVSRMLLHTKLKALTGQSTGQFIRTIRLKRAAQLLQKGSGNVTQVAYDVGFQSLSYFAKTFRDEFGISPSGFTAQK